jgi:hypothetical protein
VGLGKHSDLHCIWLQMDDSFSTMSKCIKQQGVTKFVMHKNETPTEIHRQLWDFYGEDTVDINTMASLGERIMG